METYLSRENSDQSVAGLWHSSSVCTVCLTGQNSDTSQARFDGEEHYFGCVEFLGPPEGMKAGALSPSLDPRGLEDYTLDEATSDDNEDLFPSDSELADSELSER